jgi:acyl-CoA thioesterase-1
MRAILLVVLYSLAWAAPAGAAERPVILVFGDSLSAGYGLVPGQGWVALLERRLNVQGYEYKVVNASVSGETTGGGLERLPRAIALHRPAVLFIELGANDGLRGLPILEFRANLERMIELGREAGARVVLAGVRIPSNYGPQYAEGFFSVYGELARARKVSVVPFLLEGMALRDDLFQDDRIHPGAAAQVILLDNAWATLEPLLKR